MKNCKSKDVLVPITLMNLKKFSFQVGLDKIVYEKFNSRYNCSKEKLAICSYKHEIYVFDYEIESYDDMPI